MNRKKSSVADLVIIVFLAATALLCFLPIIHTLAVSLSSKIDANAGRVYFWPVGTNLNSYKTILKDRQFFTSFGISIARVCLGTLINFIFVNIMAYPLSRNNRIFPGRNAYMWVLVFTMLFSGGIIPFYLVVNSLGLNGTLWALVLPGAVPVFNVVLMMNFFRSISKEVEESAVIDGARPLRILRSIFIPVSLPAQATILLFTVVGHWNSWFDGLILMMNPKQYPLQTYIQQLIIVINAEDLARMTPDQIKALNEISDVTLNAAKIFVTMVPVLLVYPFLQKYFIHGIMLGSVKE